MKFIGIISVLLLATAAAWSAEDPLEPVAADMTGATATLAEADVGASTQAHEQAAIGKLKSLIEQLEEQLKQMQQQGSGQGKATANPNEGMKESKVVDGPGGRGQMIQGREGANDWAKLPDRERERIIQAREEGFPAGYEALLERYYRKLAEGPAAGAEKPPEGKNK